MQASSIKFIPNLRNMIHAALRACCLAGSGALVQCPPTSLRMLPLLFPTLLHPLLPLLLHDDWGTVVGVGLGESCGHDGRALGADCCADGHEESVYALAWMRKPIDSFSSSIPKGGSRTQHVLAQSPHHAVRARAEADDVGRAEDEANDQADG